MKGREAYENEKKYECVYVRMRVCYWAPIYSSDVLSMQI